MPACPIRLYIITQHKHTLVLVCGVRGGVQSLPWTTALIIGVAF